jgi:DNA modification methylase
LITIPTHLDVHTPVHGAAIILGDVRSVVRDLPDASIDCVVTSPPYWGLRDYGVDGQIGLEQSPDAYVQELVEVFREIRRGLKDDGTIWVNLGDSYAATTKGSGGVGKSTLHGSPNDQNGQLMAPRRMDIVAAGLKQKDLVGIPWLVAFALRADGWYLRQDIIWHKPNPMPESVRDRCTKGHEYVFLFSKSPRYYFDADAIRERDGGKPAGNGFKGRQGGAAYQATSGGVDSEGWEPGAGRNKRSVWTVTPKPFKGAHFATMPPGLVEPCILAGCRPGGVVLDPFNGSGTTGVVALQHGRQYVGIELNPAYVQIACDRIADEVQP